MIQRIQSVWLFIAALLNFCILFFDLYTWHETLNGVESLHHLKVGNDYPSLILLLIIIALPIVAIFLFKQRKRQIMLIFFSVVFVLGFIALTLFRVTGAAKATPVAATGSYWIGAMLPLVSIIFFVLAIMNIRKDEKLVKSMDRLR